MQESGRFGPGMWARASRKRPIIRLMAKNRGAWMNGMGTSVATINFERAFPALTGDDWTNISVSDGDTVNACLPPTETVTFGQTSQTYQPKHKAVNTEHFCIRDILQGFQYRDFLTNVTRSFGVIADWVWYRRYTLDYFANAKHHYTLTKAQGVQNHASAYNTSNPPTATLSQGVLKNIYAELYREGGDAPAGVDVDTGAPAFTLLTSMETSEGVLRSSPEFLTDIRYAYMGKGEGSPLVGPVESKRRNYGGFVHDIDPYPRRFILTGGAYVEVAPFIASAATKGNKWDQNLAYQTAPYEESIIFHEGVYQDLAVNTVTNPAPGWNFDARTWMGEFSVRNILHETCNPDGTIIFFRALFASAAKPMNGLLGYTILHARCGFGLDLRDCYGVS